MKTLRYLLLIATSSLLMASCGYPDHLKTLPKDTVAVVSLDLAGMAVKGDLDKLQQAEFYKKMQEKMSEKDPEAAKKTDEFLKNPLNYGINFTEPVYLFATYDTTAAQANVGFSVALGDEEKFKTFIAKTADIEAKGLKIEAATGYSLLTTPEAVFAWNNFALIVLPTIDADKPTDKLLASIFAEKDKDQSVVSLPGFSNYYDNSQDISGWVSFGFLPNVMDWAKAFSPALGGGDELSEYQAQLEKFKESSMQFHVTFNDEEVFTEYSFDMPEELQKYYSSSNIMKEGSPEKLANLVRNSDLALFSASINLPEYLKLMTENPMLTGTAKEEMAQYAAMAQQFIAPFDGDLLFTLINLKEVERTVTKSVRIKPISEPLLDSLGQPIADTTGKVALLEEEEDEYYFDLDAEYKDTTYVVKETVPVFLAATTINDESFGALGLFMGKQLPKAGKVKTLDLGDEKIYTTIKDKVVILSNDKALVEEINKGTFKGDIDCYAAKGALTHGTYAYANLKVTDYPKFVQNKIAEGPKKKEADAMMKFIAMFDRLEVYNTKSSVVISMKLKANGQNSLYTLLEHTGNAAYELEAFN